MKLNVTQEMLDDLNHAYGMDVTDELEKVTRIMKSVERKRKIEKLKNNINEIK